MGAMLEDDDSAIGVRVPPEDGFEERVNISM
jgi:hypothetical protein